MSDILSVAFVLFESLCFLVCAGTFMERRRISPYALLDFVIALFLLTFLTNAVSANLENGIKKWLFIFGTYVGASFLCFRGSKSTHILTPVIFYLVAFALDYAISLIFTSILNTSINVMLGDAETLKLAATISKVLLATLTVIVKILIEKRRGKKAAEYIDARDWIVPVFLSVTSIVSLMSLIELCANLEDIPILVVVSAIGLLFSALLVFILLDAAAGRGKTKMDQALIQQRLEIKLDGLASLKNSFDAQRMLMHDYKNQITTIQQLLEKEKYGQLRPFVRSLSAKAYHSIYRIKTNNDIVDIILNQKDQEASSLGIIMNVHSGDLSRLTISTEHLLTILANVLDNAIEACATIQTKKVITVKLVVEEDVLVFSVINPVTSRVVISDNTIATTKKNKKIHGLGLMNVATSLAQCNGEYSIECKNGQFQFTALIQLDQNVTMNP